MLLTSAFVQVDQTPTVEYDAYVPLTLTWPKYRQSLKPPTVALLRGPQGFLEIKLNAQDNELLEVVVPSAAAIIVASPVEYRSASGRFCVPVFDITPGIDAIEAPDLRFEAYPNFLKIGLCAQAAREFVGAGPVTFGVGEESVLVSIILEWSSVEREDFLSSCFLVQTAS